MMARWPYGVAGVWGLLGVLMMAASAHGPLAGTNLTVAGQILLFHAVALIAVAAQSMVTGRFRLAALLALGVGSGLFSGLIAFRVLSGLSVLSPMIPIGGLLMIAGWAAFGLGAVVRRT